MTATRILGISGSLRRDSHNTSLLRAAATQLPPGVELEVFDALADVPLYNEDDDVDPAPPGAERLRDAIAGADGLLIAAPEYNGTVSGVLKNAIDWASRPYPDNALKGKPVAVVGASTSLFGAVWAQADARKALAIAGAKVIDEGGVAVREAHTAFTPEGAIAEAELEAALTDLVRLLADRVAAASAAPTGALRAA